MTTEREIGLDDLPRKRPAVPGLHVGQIVHSLRGRRMRVQYVRDRRVVAARCEVRR